VSSAGSVSQWIVQLKAGDREVARQLWEHYFRRLVGLARSKLAGRPRATDEEDVALSAFASFCQGAEEGRFPKLDDRDDLWRLLMVITARKALRTLRDEGRLKRGGGAVFLRDTDDGVLEQVIGQEPSPEFAAEAAEQFRHLLALLPDQPLQSIAMWKMEGQTNEEIAAKLACASRTVERKLQVIRDLWQAGAAP
jgi:DNA-directed RNA polymerase specialized sigma24 family protein